MLAAITLAILALTVTVTGSAWSRWARRDTEQER